MSGEPVIVFVEGGCVTWVQGVRDYNVWDWDDFTDDPVAYVEEHGGIDGECLSILRDSSDDDGLYADIKRRYDSVKAEEEKEALRQRNADPFWMVEAR